MQLLPRATPPPPYPRLPLSPLHHPKLKASFHQAVSQGMVISSTWSPHSKGKGHEKKEEEEETGGVYRKWQLSVISGVRFPRSSTVEVLSCLLDYSPVTRPPLAARRLGKRVFIWVVCHSEQNWAFLSKEEGRMYFRQREFAYLLFLGCQSQEWNNVSSVCFFCSPPAPPAATLLQNHTLILGIHEFKHKF